MMWSRSFRVRVVPPRNSSCPASSRACTAPRRPFSRLRTFQGGIRVAMGDVNGDGLPDVITAPGPGGGPLVKVFSGVDGSLLVAFNAYDSAFQGGVFVAAGDVTGRGKASIITAPGEGGGP